MAHLKNTDRSTKLEETKLFLFDCQVCFKFVGLFADIGDQETAGYSFSSTSGACVLSLTGKPFPKTGIPKRFIITFLLFVCTVYVNLHLDLYMYISKLCSIYILLCCVILGWNDNGSVLYCAMIQDSYDPKC